MNLSPATFGPIVHTTRRTPLEELAYQLESAQAENERTMLLLSPRDRRDVDRGEREPT